MFSTVEVCRLGAWSPSAPPAPPPQFLQKADLVAAVSAWATDVSGAAAVHGHISTWDVSGIADMESLFKDNADFNDDIDGWDVSRVVTM